MAGHPESLRIDHAQVAAEQFTWLTRRAAEPPHPHGGAVSYTPEELDAVADGAVTTVLHRYAARVLRGGRARISISRHTAGWCRPRSGVLRARPGCSRGS
ncbi:TetR/AcrR family transcriptional regulator C-terminal domain-containing protein [Nocardia thraciensis]